MERVIDVEKGWFLILIRGSKDFIVVRLCNFCIEMEQEGSFFKKELVEGMFEVWRRDLIEICIELMESFGGQRK